MHRMIRIFNGCMEEIFHGYADDYINNPLHDTELISLVYQALNNPYGKAKKEFSDAGVWCVWVIM